MRSTHDISIQSLFDDMANGNDEKAVSALTDAIQNGFTDSLTQLLRAAADHQKINDTYKILFKLMDHAIQKRDVETLKIILGTVKWTPPGKQNIVWRFISAIQAGDIEILKPLLTKVDWADDQEALISLLFHTYHQEKQFDIVIAILKAEGIVWNAASTDDLTEILLAAGINNHTEIIKTLLQIPGINYKYKDEKNDGFTIADYAASHGNCEIIRLLIEKLNQEEEKPEEDENDAETPARELLENAFTSAILYAQADVVKMILTEITWEKPEDLISLDKMIQFALEDNQHEMIMPLFEKIHWDERLFSQVFKDAVRKNKIEIVKELMKYFSEEEEKANKELPISYMRSLFTKTFFDSIHNKDIQNIPMAKTLLTGIDWNNDKTNFLFLLNHAVDKQHTDMAMTLLNSMHGWSDQDKKKLIDTLTYAAHRGYTEIMSTLLAMGVDCNQESETMRLTPLSYAVSKIESVKLLLEKKADPNQINSRYNTTALTHAVNEHHVDTVIALLDAGANIELLDPRLLTHLWLIKNELPKLLPAERYNNQLLEQLGYVLLTQQQLPFHHSTINKIPRNILYFIGARFIESMRGNPIELPEYFCVFLSCLFGLQIEKNNAISTTSEPHQNYAYFANEYRKKIDRVLLPTHSTTFESDQNNYKRIAAALVRIDPELYKNLDQVNPTRPCAMEYCLTVLQIINDNMLKSAQNQVEEALSIQGSIGKFYYDLAKESGVMAAEEDDLKTKLKHYDTALRFCKVAKDHEFDPAEITKLSQQLIPAYRQTRAQLSQSNPSSIEQITGSNALFGRSKPDDANQLASPAPKRSKTNR